MQNTEYTFEGLCWDLYKLLKLIFNGDKLEYISDDEAEFLCENNPNLYEPREWKEDYPGYPIAPLLKHLSSVLSQIMLKGTSFLINAPVFKDFDEGYSRNDRLATLAAVRQQLMGSLSLWEHWNDLEKVKMLRGVFKGGLPILEVRILAGYGLRFDFKPLVFRGFLEPQQQEGWLNKYRH